MFHNIPLEIQAQMQRLEQIDARDRKDGTPRLKRLRQIPPNTGKFLALLAANTPTGQIIEIGTSAGYSTLWLLLAAKELKQDVITFEILEEKIQRAKETFKAAGVEQNIKLIAGNALDYLKAYQDISFCFLDAEKEVYQACYDMIIPRLTQGGYLVADNAINHQETLQPLIEQSLQDIRVDAMVIPVGKGLLICRKI